MRRVVVQLRAGLSHARRHCIRDHVHVSYLASANLAARLTGKGPSQPVDGNGRGFSVAEVVQTTEKVTGRSVRAALPCL
jgi:UDP-glucose 4-epimerase